MTLRVKVPAWALTVMTGFFIMILLPVGANNSWPMFQGAPGHCGFTAGPLSSEHSKLWSARIGNGNLTAPVAQGGCVFIGSSDGNLYSVWEANDSVSWNFNVGSPISSVPVIDSNLVYVVSEEGRLYAVGAQGGELVWEFQLSGNATYSIPLTLSGNSLYVGSSHGDILRFQIDGAKNVVWVRELNINILGAITIGNGRAYIATEDGDVVALDIRDGASVWSTRPGPSA